MRIVEVVNPNAKVGSLQNPAKPYARTIEELRASMGKNGVLRMDGGKLQIKELRFVGAGLQSCLYLPKGCSLIDLARNLLSSVEHLDLSNAHTLRLTTNKLKSLLVNGEQYLPKVLTSLNISENPTLTSLEGCPEKVGDFYAYSTGITSLKGMPRRILGEAEFSANKGLTSLEGIAPMIAGDAIFEGCNIREIGDTGEFVVTDRLSLVSNKITSLEGIDKKLKRCSVLDLTDNPLKSHVLGVLRITDLKDFICDDNEDLDEIMNKWLKSSEPINKKIMGCQSDLLDAGLDEFAQL